MNDVSEGEKADKYNGRVYHDIATVKESEEDKALGQKTVWHITAEETVNFKRSKFLRHARGHVRFHATRDVTRASDFDHSTG